MISRRNLELSEQRVEGATLAGYAAVYGEQSRELVEGGRAFTERIAPGAFGDSVRGDVKLYYNHDASQPLARTSSGTLKLKSDRAGLAFEADLADTQLGRDVRELLKRGDLSGEMSFGFYVEEDSWNRTRTERLVKRARLVEISIVQDAAYPQTSSSLRGVRAAALEAAKARLDLFKARIRNV
jgi:HK97 family phage prohead protease